MLKPTLFLIFEALWLVSGRDACGPVIQNRPDDPVDTCVSPPILSTEPAPYGVWLDINPDSSYTSSVPPPELLISCAPSIEKVCNTLPTDGQESIGWSISRHADCSIWMFTPSQIGAAKIRTAESCQIDIFTSMLNVLVRESNGTRASINVLEGAFPNTTSNGLAVDPGYPSYILSV